MIAIVSDDKNQNVGEKLYEFFKENGETTEYISAANLDVKPCYSCGGCSTKTYRKCVIEDDMDAILRILIKADKMVFVFPLTWGSYSSNVKKVFDRSCVIGDTHYYMVKGEIVKGMQCNIKNLYAVGVKSNCSAEEEDAFHKLIDENVKIMNITGKAFILDEKEQVMSVAKEILK